TRRRINGNRNPFPFAARACGTSGLLSGVSFFMVRLNGVVDRPSPKVRQLGDRLSRRCQQTSAHTRVWRRRRQLGDIVAAQTLDAVRNAADIDAVTRPLPLG